MKYTEVEGDLIKMALGGSFDVIAHGCNCQATMKRGLAPQMAKAFGCDKFPLESDVKNWAIDKLGRIDFRHFYELDYGYMPEEQVSDMDIELFSAKKLTVVNCYTQYDWRGYYNIDYEALTLCMRKMNHIFKGMHIGLPYVIGAGLAGGDADRIISITKTELCDMDVTMVKLV